MGSHPLARALFRANLFDEARHVSLGVTARILAGRILADLLQRSTGLLGVVGPERLAEQFVHGAAVTFSQSFGLLRKLRGAG
jgi:hypothetical protein